MSKPARVIEVVDQATDLAGRMEPGHRIFRNARRCGWPAFRMRLICRRFY